MSDSLMNKLQHALVNIFSDSPLVTLEQNVDRALEAITQQLQCDGVFVMSRTRQQSHLQARNMYLKPEFCNQKAVKEWPLQDTPFFNELAAQPRLVKLSDLSQLPENASREKELLAQWQVKSLLVLPSITFGETRIAVVALSCNRPNDWSDELITELNHAAGLLGATMELTRVAQALMHSEHKYQEVFQKLPIACGLVDKDNRLTMLNSIAEHMTDAKEGEHLLALVREEEQPVLIDTLNIVREGVLNQAWCELPLQTTHNKHNWMKLSFSCLRGSSDQLVMMAEDVNENHRLADELSFQANFDALTGLPNRPHFEALLSKLVQSGDDQTHIAFLDLDQFQVINNVSGHKAGDQLLCQVAKRLKQLVRKGDVVARIGGDEFGILMHQSTSESAQAIAKRICLQLFEHEFYWQNRKHAVSVSVGLAKLDRTANEIYDVMSQADAACRLAKDEGRNGWRLYSVTDPNMHRLFTQMNSSVDVIGALALNRFELYFQPIEPLLAKEKGLHFEVLTRMLNEDGKIVSPAVFLPAAERYNLAPRVDLWVIDNLLNWARENCEIWRDLSMVSVNLSATSLGDSEFMSWLEMRLLSEPELVYKLCFEITETAALSQLEQANNLIDLLRPLGCKLALDDFGSGFSSFAYLKRLDVDFVKVDGQFVVNLCESQSDQAIVNAICQLGRDMGFCIIAEFVESEAIGYKLKDLGVDYGQGYAISKPMKLSGLKSGKHKPWLITDTSDFRDSFI